MLHYDVKYHPVRLLYADNVLGVPQVACLLLPPLAIYLHPFLNVSETLDHPVSSLLYFLSVHGINILLLLSHDAVCVTNALYRVSN